MTALPSARVVVLTRVGCHLCDEAAGVVTDLCAELAVSVAFVDVDTDELLRQRFNDHVPVIFVDGEQHAQWFVDAERLRAALLAT